MTDSKDRNQISIHYNTQLWAIPVVFFSLVGFVLQALDRSVLVSWWNLIVLIVGFTLSSFLFLLLHKIHCQQKRLQKIIGETDPELASFFHPDSDDFESDLAKIPIAFLSKAIMLLFIFAFLFFSFFLIGLMLK